MVKKGIVLGHKISVKEIEVERPKIQVIEKLPLPISVKEMQSFLGHMGFYRRFNIDFSKIVNPLCKLLKEVKFKLNEEFLKAFNCLKENLVETPIMIAPNWSKSFDLIHDTSGVDLGLVLGQNKEKLFHPIYYTSTTLNGSHKNYTINGKEVLK